MHMLNFKEDDRITTQCLCEYVIETIYAMINQNKLSGNLDYKYEEIMFTREWQLWWFTHDANWGRNQYTFVKYLTRQSFYTYYGGHWQISYIRKGIR